jgi:hypothetical protein
MRFSGFLRKLTSSRRENGGMGWRTGLFPRRSERCSGRRWGRHSQCRSGRCLEPRKDQSADRFPRSARRSTGRRIGRLPRLEDLEFSVIPATDEHLYDQDVRPALLAQVLASERGC